MQTSFCSFVSGCVHDKVTLHTKPFLSGFGSMFHVLFTLGISASFLTHYERNYLTMLEVIDCVPQNESLSA